MIEINLLPKELRRKKKVTQQAAIEMPKIPVVPIGFGIVAVLVVVHLLFMAITISNKAKLSKLEKNWTNLEPQRKQTEKIAKEIAALTQKDLAISKIAKGSLSWTKLLSGLNKAVIPNVWLSGFDLKINEPTKKVKEYTVNFTITGYALGASEQATALVGKFISSLERINDFSEYFDIIELENMRSSIIAGDEVMLFNLKCKSSNKELISGSGSSKK